jgi:hypothetical protein
MNVMLESCSEEARYKSAKFYSEEVLVRGIELFERILHRGIALGEFREVVPRDLLLIFVGPILILLLARQSIGRHAELHFDLQEVLSTHIEMFLWEADAGERQMKRHPHHGCFAVSGQPSIKPTGL